MRDDGRPAVTVLDPALYRRTPWKNGGGVSVDIAEEVVPGSEPGAWSGLVWRLARTRIERPGPFSDLSGCDRILTVIEGRGLRLRPAVAPVVDVAEPLRPARFPGEWPIVSELQAGPVGVLNLIADRGRAAIDLAILAQPGERTIDADVAVLYGPTGPAAFRWAGRDVALPPDGALRAQIAAPALLEHRSGVLAVATIRLKRSA